MERAALQLVKDRLVGMCNQCSMDQVSSLLVLAKRPELFDENPQGDCVRGVRQIETRLLDDLRSRLGAVGRSQ